MVQKGLKQDFIPYGMIELLALALVLPGTTEWEFLDGADMGAELEYYICDEQYLDSYTDSLGKCYWAVLAFMDAIRAGPHRYHPVLVTTTDDESRSADKELGTGRSTGLYIIDASAMSVIPLRIQDRDTATSLDNTLFWSDGWGFRHNLALGSEVVRTERLDPDTTLIVREKLVGPDGGSVFTAEYSDYARNHVTINTSVFMPVEAQIHTRALSEGTQRLLFSFELVSSDGVADEGPDGGRLPEIFNPHHEITGEEGRVDRKE